MKRIKPEQVKYKARNYYNNFIAGYGLENSLRIVRLLKSLLLDEKKRRKSLKK